MTRRLSDGGIIMMSRARMPEGYMYLTDWSAVNNVPRHYAYYASQHKGLHYLRHYGRQIIKISTTPADVGYRMTIDTVHQAVGR